ncbi:hypothetical protein EDB19DRAFT_382359 [Suillus lakei]|nr:hypothetical protein EDB19DRAFT_382359 [Suillus lakei]
MTMTIIARVACVAEQPDLIGEVSRLIMPTEWKADEDSQKSEVELITNKLTVLRGQLTNLAAPPCHVKRPRKVLCPDATPEDLKSSPSVFEIGTEDARDGSADAVGGENRRFRAAGELQKLLDGLGVGLRISHIRTVNLPFAPTFGLGGNSTSPPAKKPRCMLLYCRLTVLGFTVLGPLAGTATGAYVRNSL